MTQPPMPDFTKPLTYNNTQAYARKMAWDAGETLLDNRRELLTSAQVFATLAIAAAITERLPIPTEVTHEQSQADSDDDMKSLSQLAELENQRERNDK